MKYFLYKAALEKLAEDICLSVELKKMALEKLAYVTEDIFEPLQQKAQVRKFVRNAEEVLESMRGAGPTGLGIAHQAQKGEIAAIKKSRLSPRGKALLALALVPAIGGAGYGAYTLGRRRKSRKRR